MHNKFIFKEKYNVLLIFFAVISNIDLITRLTFMYQTFYVEADSEHAPDMSQLPEDRQEDTIKDTYFHLLVILFCINPVLGALSFIKYVLSHKNDSATPRHHSGF